MDCDDRIRTPGYGHGIVIRIKQYYFDEKTCNKRRGVVPRLKFSGLEIQTDTIEFDYRRVLVTSLYPAWPKHNPSETIRLGSSSRIDVSERFEFQFEIAVGIGLTRDLVDDDKDIIQRT